MSSDNTTNRIAPPPKGCELLRENVFDDDLIIDDGDGERLKRREPTMLQKGQQLVAPASEKQGKPYTVVFDLDETVVYSRDGPLYARAYLKDLLRSIKEHFEVIVWTAGDRDYAKTVLEEINEDHIIEHLVYRHERWFNERDYTKDLAQLGRDLRFTIIVENTPDCVRANPENGIIVEDFEVAQRYAPEEPVEASQGGEAPTCEHTPVKPPRADRTLYHLKQVLLSLAESKKTVPQFLKQCDQLSKQCVKGSDGSDISIYYLDGKQRRRRAGQKVVRENRDKQPKSPEEETTAAPEENEPHEPPASRHRVE